MPRSLLKLSLFCAALLCINTTYSQAPTGSNNPGGLCQDILNSCKEGGYSETQTGSKGLGFCIASLMKGVKLEKVNVTPAQLAHCKDQITTHPCNKILTQCKNAGFNGTEKKLPNFDCLMPIVLDGVTIPGVQVTSEDLAVCKDFLTKQLQSQPCMRVMLACKKAGYSPDTSNGDIFARNCYNPLLEGKTVAGVNIDTDTIKACKAAPG